MSVLCAERSVVLYFSFVPIHFSLSCLPINTCVSSPYSVLLSSVYPLLYHLGRNSTCTSPPHHYTCMFLANDPNSLTMQGKEVCTLGSGPQLAYRNGNVSMIFSFFFNSSCPKPRIFTITLSEHCRCNCVCVCVCVCVSGYGVPAIQSVLTSRVGVPL